MRVNLYYAPYPSQIFARCRSAREHGARSQSQERSRNLGRGCAQVLDEAKVDVEFRIIDTQIDVGTTVYKSIPYGPRTLVCRREGGAFESYDDRIREADIHGISNNYTNSAGISLISSNT